MGLVLYQYKVVSLQLQLNIKMLCGGKLCYLYTAYQLFRIVSVKYPIGLYLGCIWILLFISICILNILVIFLENHHKHIKQVCCSCIYQNSHLELILISNTSFIQAYNDTCNDTISIEFYLFGWGLCVCCFIVHLNLYLGSCTICACCRSVGG